MKSIAILNHKGGTGKTTSSINIGAGLAKKGKKVLLVDIDPQANLTEGLGVRDPKISIYDVSGIQKNFLLSISEKILISSHLPWTYWELN